VNDGQLVTLMDVPLVPKDSFFLVLSPSLSAKARQRDQFADWLVNID
jgi:hypothetical protein